MSTVQRDGQPAADAQGPTVPRMLVGIELHRYREAAGITPDQAAYEIRASRSKISRMENGLVRFKERDVTDLLTLYGITDEQIRGRLVTLARQANTPGWWSKYGDALDDWFEAYLGLEPAASVIRSFHFSSCSSYSFLVSSRPVITEKSLKDGMEPPRKDSSIWGKSLRSLSDRSSSVG